MKIKYRQGNKKARVFFSICLGFIILFCLVVTLITMSCKSPEVRIDPDTLLPITVTDDGETVIDNPVVEPTIPVSSSETYSDIEKRMSGVTWLSPGKVNIDGLYPGATGEYYLRIHNSKDDPATFSIYSKEANTCTEGYTKLPPEFNKWIKINPSSIVIPAKSVGEVLVSVTVGLRDKATNKKYEIWIGAMDESQKGLVKSEICSRWMLTTK